MLEIGTRAPEFNLPDVKGERVSIDFLEIEKGLLVMFICNHCPYVKHLNNAIVGFANNYQSKGIRCVAISSNDIVNYPQDAPGLMKEVAEKEGFPFPYLYDETQETAKAYKAACTPDFFLFDENLKLFYRGRFDDSRPGSGKPVTGVDLKNAADALLKAEEPVKDQIPSVGCNIKWKPGNEPEYYGV